MQRKSCDWKTELCWTKYLIFALCEQNFLRYITWNLAGFFLTDKGWYTYDVHENCPILKIPTPCLSMFKILPLPWSNTSNFKRIPSPTSPTSPENYNQSIKRKHKPRTTIASYQQVNKSIIIKGWLYCLTSESKGRFLVSNVLMLGSALFLVMAQIHFPLIKK